MPKFMAQDRTVALVSGEASQDEVRPCCGWSSS